MSILVLWLSGALAGSASAQIITEYPLPTPNSSSEAIVTGPDGNLWFAVSASSNNKVGRITVGGSIDEFPVWNCCGLFAFAAGTDGNIWFTENNLPGYMGRITTLGDVTEFPIPGTTGPSYGIVAGPDGNMWFTEGADDRVARITTDLVITEFPVLTDGSYPMSITAGPDGNLWFTEIFGNKIGRITPSGTVTEFDVPTADSNPQGITAGPDGNLWFTEEFGGKVGRITTAGAVTEFLSSLQHPRGITAGQDGNLWFTEFGGNRLWRLSVDGTATSYSIPTPGSEPSGITAGPDGAIWFTEFAKNKVGRLFIPSAPEIASIVPRSGPADGGTAIVVSGAQFQPGAELTIGGETAGNVIIVGPEEIDAETPLLSPGTLNNVIVTNPDTGIAVVAQGFLADFLDVPQGDIFHDYVEKIFRHGVTAGCGQGNYCRNVPVYRAPMAVFLLKAEHGAKYSPPPCAGIFLDVECPGPFADWVEQLSSEGITGGCGGGNYCPSGYVTRAQMSVFLLKTEHGADHVPPPCTGVFDDVECPTLFADWIEEFYAEGITGGCSTSPLLYCPGSFSTRGQMAVFLVKTFGLP